MQIMLFHLAFGEEVKSMDFVTTKEYAKCGNYKCKTYLGNQGSATWIQEF